MRGRPTVRRQARFGNVKVHQLFLLVFVIFHAASPSLQAESSSVPKQKLSITVLRKPPGRSIPFCGKAVR